MILNPFQPGPDATVTTAITGTAQTITVSTTGRNMAYRFANIGTQTIYFLVYPSGATVTAVTAATGIPMLANTVEMFTLPPNAQVSVIAGSTGSTLSITPGEGA